MHEHLLMHLNNGHFISLFFLLIYCHSFINHSNARCTDNEVHAYLLICWIDSLFITPFLLII